MHAPSPILSEYADRQRKSAELITAGISPYPAKAERSHMIADVIKNFDAYTQDHQSVTLAGRLRSKRVHGNLCFADLMDASGTFQIALNKKTLGDSYGTFIGLIDSGDFISVRGTLFTTNAGQQTLAADHWTLLTKSLRGIPSEHFGIKNDEERYRKRYLDLLLSPDLRARFMRRSLFWNAMRQFLTLHEFQEVETPSLEVTTGGAEARPFASHHNDYNMPVYLRISIGELWQKRLMAAGFEKTFEIGRAFRNEGTSPNHLQEFTNMEFYWAYASYEDGMQFVEKLYRHIAHTVYGRASFTSRGHTVDLDRPWKRIDYRDTVYTQTGVDVCTASEADLRAALDRLAIPYDAQGAHRDRYIDTLWKHCRAHIAGPAFLVNHPAAISPLAKRSSLDPERVERFQVILGGTEIGNGYSELNDPLDQRARFAQQQKLRDDGDDEAMMPDWEFVEMLEYGMPPTCGFGVGERLFAFFEDTSLRDATLFPLMKPSSPQDTPC